MAAFPARSRPAFDAHWTRMLSDPAVIKQAIVHRGHVVGNIVCWDRDGQRHVGYWIGREPWGRGIATRALAALLRAVDHRPLYARVARHNVASIRVLEKCGFGVVREDVFTEVEGVVVHELLLRLDE